MSVSSVKGVLQKCPRCKKCFKLLIDGYLLESNCSACYCSRCVSEVHQHYYLNKISDIIIQLPCGHFIDRPDVQRFLQNTCINCGNLYDPAKDIEMREGAKLCRYCFDYNLDKYRDYLYECLNCNRTIRSLSFLANTEIVMCKECAKSQSVIHSRIEQEVSESHRRKLAESKGEGKRTDSDEEGLNEISIVSRFSAFQIEEEKGSKEKGAQRHKMKINSKHSVEIKVQNFKIKIKTDAQQRQRCTVCGCLICRDSLVPNLGKQSQKMCRICFGQTIDVKQKGYYRNLARSSAGSKENERLTHISVPKKHFDNSVTDSAKNMKKSVVVGTEIKSNYNLFQPSKFAASLAVKKTPTIEPWQKAVIEKGKECQICEKKTYMITRPDQKRVCSNCYNKP